MNEKADKAILEVLSSKGLLSKEQIDSIFLKEDILRARLQKSRTGTIRRGRGKIDSSITIVDIVDSLKFNMPGEGNRYLTEEIIMETVARHLDLPFLRIDPLKLDSDIVTKVISRPYALKHMLLPIDLSNNTLTDAFVDSLLESDEIDHRYEIGVKLLHPPTLADQLSGFWF